MKSLLQILAVVSVFAYSITGFSQGGISGGGGAGGGAHGTHPHPHASPTPVPLPHEKPDQKLSVDLSNDLGLKLMRAKVSEDLRAGRIANTMISPISAAQAFSMALNGAGGKTRRELLQKLGAIAQGETLDDDALVDLINISNADLRSTLQIERSVVPTPQGAPVSPVVTISNSAWRTTGASDGKRFVFSDDFIKRINDSYQADVAALDFVQKSSTDKINAWVDEKTDGLIKSIFKTGDLKDLLWVIVNATYFEGGWETHFSKWDQENFTLTNGATKQVPMISSRHADFAYYADNSREVIEIPFHAVSGKSFSFFVIAPKAGAEFNSLQRDQMWQSQYWQSAEQALADHGGSACTVTMPELQFNSGADLEKNSPLTEAIGLDFLFANNADFSPMATKDSEPSNVKFVRQQTRMELDENGVKAAAVTSISGGAGHAAGPHPVPPCIHVVLNHPFAFAIMDRASKALLFVGSVVEP